MHYAEHIYTYTESIFLLRNSMTPQPEVGLIFHKQSYPAHSFQILAHILIPSIHAGTHNQLVAAVPLENSALEMMAGSVEAGAEEKTDVVLIEDSEFDTLAASVTADGLTVNAGVLMRDVLVEAAPLTTTAAVVWVTVPFPAALEVAEALMTVLERMDPVTVTVTGTLTVAVIVVGEADGLAVEAAVPQESFCEVHSSNENPGPEIATQESNWCPQDAAAAEARSSNSSSKTLNESPDLPTEGHRPPRVEVNSKNVSTTVTTVLDALEDLPAPNEELDKELRRMLQK